MMSMPYLMMLGLLAANVRAGDLPTDAVTHPDAFFDQRASLPAGRQADGGAPADSEPPTAAPQTVPAKPHPIVAAAVTDPTPAPAPAQGWHPKHSAGATVGIACATGVTAAGIGALVGLIMGLSLPGIGWAALIGFGIGAVIGVFGGIFG
jgi:hypothetical protein